jgi:exonuclease VII small subunit
MNTKSHTLLSYLLPLFILLSAYSFFFQTNAQTPVATSTMGATEAADRRITPEEREERLEDRLENRQDIVGERQASTSERIEARQELRTERQAALEEVRQKRVLNLAANISNRMEAAIARLYDIVARFELRVAKLKAAGVDTAAAEAKIREASQALAEARGALSPIDTLVNDATTSTEPQKNWTDVRSTYQTTAQLIRASHQALREAIALLKTAAADADLRRSAAVSKSSTTASTTE